MVNNYVANFVSIINYSIITKRNYCKILYTNLGGRIVSLLFNKGYISYYRFIKVNSCKHIYIYLKYQVMFNPIFQIKLISTSGNNIHWSLNRLKLEHISANTITKYILSTSKGILMDDNAIENGIGGKLLFKLN